MFAFMAEIAHTRVASRPGRDNAAKQEEVLGIKTVQAGVIAGQACRVVQFVPRGSIE